MAKVEREVSRTERAQQARKEQQRSERRRMLITVGLMALALIVVAGGLFALTRGDEQGDAEVPLGSADNGLVVGKDSAPTKVIIYEDFLCPVCGEFESETSEDLNRLASEGKVQVEYRPFVLLSRFGDYSLNATAAFATVLDKSGPETAKKFHDELFADQPEEGGDYPSLSDLADKAVEAGAKESEVREPIEKLEDKQWAVNATDAATKAGVQGTPTVYVDDKPLEGATISEMADNLIEKIESAD